MSVASSPGDDLVAIAEAARHFLGQEYHFGRRAADLQDNARDDRTLWRRFAELGWLGLSLQETFGGVGGGATESWMLAQGLGAHLVLEPYLSSVIVCGWALAEHGSDALRQRILPELIAGRLQLALAHDEPSQEHPHIPSTVVAPRAGGWHIAGRKAVVLGAPTADRILVSARGDERTMVLLIDPRDAAVTIRPYRLIDGRQAGEVQIDGAWVGPDAVVALGDDAEAMLETARLAGAIGCVAELVGVMRAALSATAEHLRTRRQFGQPLAALQALRHRVADMHIDCEEADALGWRAAQAYGSADPTERLIAIAAAKAQVGEMARRLCEEAVQLHGAIAITDEFPVGHYLKRAVVDERLFGNSEMWNRRFGDMLLAP